MRTLTEFSGSTIRGAAEAKKKLLAEGVAAEQLSERLGADLNLTGDRLARLVEALEAVGDRTERVRLVRVFAATDEPKGAKKIGEFNYLIDLQPGAGGPKREERRDDRRRDDRRGGRDDRGGPRKPKGPMGLKSLTKAAKATPEEKKDDEREERGGRPPTVGQGWVLTRDPGAIADEQRRRNKKGPPRGRGKPGKPGDRGRPGDRRGPPTEFRGPRPPRPEGAQPQQQPGAPGEEQKKKRRRRRRGRGPGGPRPPGMQGPPQAPKSSDAPPSPPETQTPPDDSQKQDS